MGSMKCRAFMPVVVALLPLGPGAAHAFCVSNALPDRTATASLALPRPQAPARLFEETVAPGREACCNPRNFECNPTRVPETASLPFAARVDPPEGAPREIVALSCGPPTDARDPGHPRRVVNVPARGFLRIERNPQFDPRHVPDVGNPPFIAKVLASGNGPVLAIYPCSL